MYQSTHPWLHNDSRVVTAKTGLGYAAADRDFDGEIPVLVSVKAKTGLTVLTPDEEVSVVSNSCLMSKARKYLLYLAPVSHEVVSKQRAGYQGG